MNEPNAFFYVPCDGSDKTERARRLHTLFQRGDVPFSSKLLGRRSLDFSGRNQSFPFIPFLWEIEGMKVVSFFSCDNEHVLLGSLSFRLRL